MLQALLLAVLVATAPALAGDPLKDALAKLQQRYDTTKTLRADFAQTVSSATLAGTLDSKGTVVFAKPNRMRWDYAAPEQQTIVGDGETLWIYQPDLKQVIKTPLGDAFQSRTPVTFLAGLGNVERDFVPSLEKETPDAWALRLVPRQKDSGVGTLILSVRKADASVAEARITDAAGTTTTIRFDHEQRNQPVPPDTFRFEPPPGVDVVKPPTY
jgi:chaperone LolA